MNFSPMSVFRLPVLLLFLLTGCTHTGVFTAEISVYSEAWAEDVYLHIDQSKIAIYQDIGPVKPVGQVQLSHKTGQGGKEGAGKISGY